MRKTTQKQTALDLVATHGKADFVLSATQRAKAEQHRAMLGNNPTPQQVELFSFDPLNYDWAERFFGKLPKAGAEYFRKLYNKQLKKHLFFSPNGGYSSGYFAGSKARQYTLDVLMPRVDRVLAQYSHIVAITDPLHTQFYLDTLERPSGENGFVQSQRKPLYLYTKKEIDKLFALPLATFFTQCLEEFATENMGKVAEDKMLAYFCKLYRKIGKYCADLWLPLPHWEKLARDKITIEQIQSDISRACCTDYWNKRLHKAKIHMAEHIAIATGQVNKHSSAYISEDAFQQYQIQKRKSFDWIKNQILINIDDPEEQAELVKTYIRSSANPEIRRKELMNKLRGIEEYAEQQGDVALFLTLTAPSSFHAYHSKGGFNEKWQGQAPKETQKYLCGQWAKMRAAWGRADIDFYGMRVVEPHHDGTPHWHILVYLKPQKVEEFERTFLHYALEIDGDEKGAKEHRCKIERCDPKKGSATGYITKYISKNINGYALDGEISDETGESLKSTAYKASAWASLWRIRQFQDFGIPPISVWRELRRLGNKQILDDEEMEALRLECDEGRFAGYIALQGGTDKKRVELLARLSYDQNEQNAYFETRSKIVGVYNQLKLVNATEDKNESRKIIKTRLKKWAIVRKPSDWEEPNHERSEPVLNSERSSPWTCVNNCTGSKNKQISAEDRECIRNELILMKGRVTEHQIDDLLRGKPLKIYSNEQVKVYVEYIDGQLVERKQYKH